MIVVENIQSSSKSLSD